MAAPGTFKRTLKRDEKEHAYLCQMALPYRLIRQLAASAVPGSYALLCALLSYWLNNRDGDCVTAEQMYNIDAAMTAAGKGGYVAPDADVLSFGRKYGLMNGADLHQVNQLVATNGFPSGGNVFKDGPDASVNYKDTAEFNAAIVECSGSIQLGIDAGPLEAAFGSGTFSFMRGVSRGGRTDHCIGTSGYGMAGDCLEALNTHYAAQISGFQKLSLPSGFAPSTPSKILFSWNHYFIAEDTSVEAITTDANIRTPTCILNGTPLVPTNVNPPQPPAPPAFGIAPPGIPYFGCYDKAGNPLWDIKKWPWSAPLVKSVGGIADNAALAKLYDALRAIDLALNTRIPG